MSTNTANGTINLAQLEPTAVWSHFQTLCQIPRPSKHEQALRDYLLGWAELLDLATEVDAAGNLIIRKPATLGMENRQGVVLQGHLDMVCQANTGTVHDFFKDPIRPVMKDGWLVAENTTLGADNGLGVAFALAVLESNTLAHGPIEVLLTVDEEAGMGGALGLASGRLQGDLLINIDTEEWGELYLGCAGGADVDIRRVYQSEAVPTNWPIFKVTLDGLMGGHSGADIHLGRGNANKLLIRLLTRLAASHQVRLIEIDGGTARNALPREAYAMIAVPVEHAATLALAVSDYASLLRQEFALVDEGVKLRTEAFSQEAAGSQPLMMTLADQAAILNALNATPHGVKRMSAQISGVVETSNNLGIISLKNGTLFANCMVRSLIDSGVTALADEIISLYALIGAEAQAAGQYPGWAPNANSPLLALFKDVYQKTFDEPAQTQVIHAGLECGLIGSKYPNMDMISFGPTIRGAHAPGERVEVATVALAWQFLQAVLQAVPVKA
jgi:dipeptidase D